MAFWHLNHPSERVALIDPNGRVHTYGALKDTADGIGERFDRFASRDIGFILFEVHAAAIATYLGALRCGSQIPLLLQPGINPSLLHKLIDTYLPRWIAATTDSPLHQNYSLIQDFGGYGLFARDNGEGYAIPHPDCGLLLSTSGSTGSPKLVRLSYSGLAHNAYSITRYLNLNCDDRAITTLPLAYSFGMSILNSHLAVGGSITLTHHNLMTKEFWIQGAANDITSLSGVPGMFEMFRRVGIAERGLRKLRMLTQAGGRLSDELIRHFASLAENNGWSFFVMYGQTEASPRISYVPPDRLSEKVGSIGIPIPDGSLKVEDSTGELVYEGPNVMMGYAISRDEIAKPDECRGTLRTGDLGRRDQDGFFYLTGRRSRFVKLSGSRINLDEVENSLSTMVAGKVACVGQDDKLTVVFQKDIPIRDLEVQERLRDLFNVFAGLVRVQRIPVFPELASGKVDYKALERMVAS
jgi:acyl-CoA synthetase (AMP-forming)/AMP-acid ligase II